MLDFNAIILKVTKKLYPTGRAFKIFTGSWKESFYKGLIKSEERAYIDGLAILDSILPDNENFTVEDARLWERRLGIFGNEESTLQERKEAILRKMNFPGVAKARQHFLYLEGELQKAGFPVFIHENTTGTNPAVVIGNAFNAVYSTSIQYGHVQYGTSNLKLVVNSIDQKIDDTFVVVAPYNALFFIGGVILGDFVNIPKAREQEFRQLILSVKSVQTIGILLINYTA